LKRGGTLIVKERSVPSAKKAKFTALIQLVKCWLYSWMQHGFFETEDEHHISKALFFFHLRNHNILRILQAVTFFHMKLLFLGVTKIDVQSWTRTKSIAR
jgi:hypothetical protein